MWHDEVFVVGGSHGGSDVGSCGGCSGSIGNSCGRNNSDLDVITPLSPVEAVGSSHPPEYW